MPGWCVEFGYCIFSRDDPEEGRISSSVQGFVAFDEELRASGVTPWFLWRAPPCLCRPCGLLRLNVLAPWPFSWLVASWTEVLSGRSGSCSAQPSRCLQCVVLPGKTHSSNPCLAALAGENLPGFEAPPRTSRWDFLQIHIGDNWPLRFDGRPRFRCISPLSPSFKLSRACEVRDKACPSSLM